MARIAIVQSLDGYLTVVGPDDFQDKDHADAMSAALSWHMEAGHLPAASYWVDVELPTLPTIPELKAKAEAHEFPKSFIDEIDSE